MYKVHTKDKCTTLKDPYKYGRMVGSSFIAYMYAVTVTNPTFVTVFVASLIGFVHHGAPLIIKKSDESLGVWSSNNTPKSWDFQDSLPAKFKPFFNIRRLTYKSDLDCLGLPFEIDRLTLAYGYLDWKKYTGNPLIRAAD